MNSPFKFLDSYGLDDKKIFFGRNEEIEQLYKLIFQTRLLLVYGASGTGKTSLIQCGLGNRFNPLDWFPIFVRRKDDINVSLDQEFRRAALTPIADDATTIEAIRSLYLDHLRPIYVILDQFEELFILGTADEQTRFITTIKTILASDTRCKIIISMREEYLAMLHEFEKAVPTLFDTRLRIEQMKMSNVEQVITGTTAALGIALENGAGTAQRIIENISDRRAGVQLSYLQVYLDKLYREAAATPTPLLFTDALVDETGALGDVMADFLDEQTAEIQADITKGHPDVQKDAVQRILEEMTTYGGTKQPMPRADLAKRLPKLVPVLDQVLGALEKSRILREADGIYELAHDSLAGRIAERRGSDRKALMRVEKLVKDRLAGFEQAKTFLAPEELALARPVLAQLDLSPAAAAFVQQSISKEKRRRLLITGGTASVIAVLAAFGLFAYDGRQRATKALVLASDTTNELSFNIFDELRSIKETQDIRRRLLEKVEAVDDELEKGGAPANSSAPFWRTVLEGDIAVENLATDETGKAFSVAEEQFRKALEMSKRMERAFPMNADWQRNQSVALGRLGQLLAKDGRIEDAGKALAAAVAIDEALQKARPSVFETNFDLAGSLGDLGAAEEQAGKIPEAAALYGRSLAILRQLAGKTPANAAVQYPLATGAMRLGALELERKGFAAATALYSEAATLLGALGVKDPTNLQWRADLASAWRGLARAGLLQDKWVAARAASDEALKVAGRLADVDPDNFERQNLLSQLHWQRAEIEKQAGDMVSARKSAQKSLAAALQLDEADPENIDWQETLAQSYRQLAEVEKGQCRFDAARDASLESIKIAKELQTENTADPVLAYNLFVAQEARAEIESHDRSFKAAAAATAEALRIATALQAQRPQDQQLRDDVKRLQTTKRNLDARIALPLPKGCLPGDPG